MNTNLPHVSGYFFLQFLQVRFVPKDLFSMAGRTKTIQFHDGNDA